LSSTAALATPSLNRARPGVAGNMPVAEATTSSSGTPQQGSASAAGNGGDRDQLMLVQSASNGARPWLPGTRDQSGRDGAAQHASTEPAIATRAIVDPAPDAVYKAMVPQQSPASVAGNRTDRLTRRVVAARCCHNGAVLSSRDQLRRRARSCHPPVHSSTEPASLAGNRTSRVSPLKAGRSAAHVRTQP
jgi:hypothetical protein